MNLQNIILEWIGVDKVEQSSLNVGPVNIPDIATQAVNQALADIRARVPELIESIILPIVEDVEDIRQNQNLLYAQGFDPFAKIIFTLKRNLYNVDSEGRILGKITSE